MIRINCSKKKSCN